MPAKAVTVASKALLCPMPGLVRAIYVVEGGEVIESLRTMAAMGFTIGHGGIRNAWDTRKFEYFQKEIIPAADAL